MNKLIDLGMSKLFQLADYVCSKTGVMRMEAERVAPQAQQETVQATPTIRFSNEDRMVEGDLFK